MQVFFTESKKLSYLVLNSMTAAHMISEYIKPTNMKDLSRMLFNKN